MATPKLTASVAKPNIRKLKANATLENCNPRAPNTESSRGATTIEETNPSALHSSKRPKVASLTSKPALICGT